MGHNSEATTEFSSQPQARGTWTHLRTEALTVMRGDSEGGTGSFSAERRGRRVGRASAGAAHVSGPWHGTALGHRLTKALVHTVTAEVKNELEMLTCCKRKGSAQQLLPERRSVPPARPSGVGRAPLRPAPLPRSPGKPPVGASPASAVPPEGAGELPDVGLLLPFREETVLDTPGTQRTPDAREGSA